MTLKVPSLGDVASVVKLVAICQLVESVAIFMNESPWCTLLKLLAHGEHSQLRSKQQPIYVALYFWITCQAACVECLQIFILSMRLHVGRGMEGI